MNPIEQLIATGIENGITIGVLIWLLISERTRAEKAETKAHEAKDRHITYLERKDENKENEQDGIRTNQ